MSEGSIWQNGYPWMRLEREAMPLKSYSELTVSQNIEDQVRMECYDHLLEPKEDGYGPHHEIFSIFAEEVFINSVSTGRIGFGPLIDPIHHGWFRTIRIIQNVLRFVGILIHRLKHAVSDPQCFVCNQSIVSEKLAEEVLMRYETLVVKATLKPDKLNQFKEFNSVLYYQSRITEEKPFTTHDLDQVPFLDTHEFTGKVFVIFLDSPVLYSYIMLLHNKILPHAGIEITMKELSKKFKVHGNIRGLIRRIKKDCSRCNLILKKTVELEMSIHPGPRTILAPPFYSVMLDIAYGFAGQPYKGARKNIKVYAIVMVCLMSGATSIMALEGIETQDIAQAIERHSARYGVPAEMFIDQGTQLKAMDQALFSVRDLQMQVIDSLGIRLQVSNAKSHEERGRVERKIRTIRETLEKTGVKTSDPKTPLQWDCIFAKIANTLDDLPMARGDSSNVSNLGFEIITPNRLKMGRNNNRSLEGSGFKFEKSQKFSRILERNRETYQVWFQLFIDNIHNLAMKPNKWNNNSRMPIVEDIVLFVYTDAGYSKENISWKLGRVIEVSERKVKLIFLSKTSKSGKPIMHQLERNPRDVSILFSVGDFSINTQDHFNHVINN